MGIHLESLSLDKVGEWPPLLKVMAVFMIALFSLIIGYSSFVRGDWAYYRSLQLDSYRLKDDLEKNYRYASQWRAYDNQLRTIKTYADDRFNYFVSQPDIPGLLAEITQIGLASGLSFELLTPLAEVEHDFYIELPVKVSVFANYYQLLGFIHQLYNLDKIVTVHDFVLRVDLKKKMKDQLHMDMTLNLYRHHLS